MATVNVYVSDELKAAMGEHELNWSRLAADAFETAINLERTKAMSIEQGSIERLRSERAQAIDRREAEGIALGKQWAQGTSFEQLERVAAIDEDQLTGEDADAQMTLATALNGDDGRLSWNEVAAELEPIFGRDSPIYSEVFGFIIGATEIFDQV